MQIDRLTHGAISAMFKAYDSEQADEIEAMFTGEALDRSSMQRLLEYLRSTSARRLQGSEVTTTTSLDVGVDLVNRLGSVRVTLTGEDVIQAALMTRGDPSGWSTATVMHKRRLRPTVEVHEHRFRVNMKREEALTDDGEQASARVMASSWDPGTKKVYRMKRRFSFPSPDPCFRFDVTAVRQITHPSPTWVELSAVPERYEVECEYMAVVTVVQPSPEKLATSLLKCFGTILKVLDDTDFLLTVSQRDSVLSEFLTMMHPSDRKTWTAQVVAGSVHAKFLPGPKPVTLEAHHLIEHGGMKSSSRSRRSQKHAVPACEQDIQETAQGSVSVVGGTPYTVTEKADGVHRVLFVSSKGKAYTLSVDGVVRVRDTGLTCRAGGRGSSSIIDGEYIPGNATAGALFAAYDAFFFEAGDVRRLPLMLKDEEASKSESGVRVLSRLAACQVVASALAESSKALQVSMSTRMMVKKFMRYEGDMDGLTACVRQVMARRDAKNYPYSIDGVILTPATWPMGAKSDAPDAASQSDGTWPATLKWKPPEQNSIDFLVKIIPGEIVRRNNASYRVAHLFVGYDPAKWDPVTTLALLTDSATPAARKAGGAYIERWFGVPGEQAGLHVCHIRVEDGDEERMLCRSGDEVVNATIVEFTFDLEREEDVPLSFCWIPLRPRPDKTQRYTTSGGDIGGAANDIATALSVWMSILSPITEDVMCGRAPRAGGNQAKDLPAAYYINKVRPGDGGMASMRDFHNWVKSADLLLRLRGNTTRSLFDIGCGRGGDLHTWRKLGVSRILGVDLYRAGIVDPENGGNMRILDMKKRNGRMGDPFPRIVLLQMDASRPIDAVQIDALDEASGDRQVARVVWSLVDSSSIKDERLRRYHGFAGAGGFDVGLRIKVYVQTIGQALEEFLVDYRLLRVAMAEVGLVPPDASQLAGLGLSAKDVPEGTCTFEAAFSRMRDLKGQKDEEMDRKVTTALQMTDDEKAFSFLNRWFIFVKTSRSRTV